MSDVKICETCGTKRITTDHYTTLETNGTPCRHCVRWVEEGVDEKNNKNDTTRQTD